MTNNSSEAPPIVNLSYKKGDLIIKEGDYGVSIYNILKGKVSVYREAEGEEILLGTLGVGDIFGETNVSQQSCRHPVGIRSGS